MFNQRNPPLALPLPWKKEEGSDKGDLVGRIPTHWREGVLFIGTPFSNLYTLVHAPAIGRVVVCLVFVIACKYALGHSEALVLRDRNTVSFIALC